MMKRALAVLAAIVASGCGQDDMDMTHSLGEVGGHLQSLTLESGGHRSMVEGTTDLNTVAGLEVDHFGRSMSHLDAMMGNMNDMGMCRHSAGAGPDLETMADELDELRAECGAHRNAMAKATDMATALAEEGRHQAAMAELMGRMSQTYQGMMGEARSYSCPMHGAH